MTKRALIGGLALAFVLAGLSHAPAHARPYGDGRMVVVGDSISEVPRYNDIRGSSKRAWWSFLADAADLRPVSYGESGSGYGKKGACTGTSFLERMKRPSRTANIKAASAVRIEGGVNDFETCEYDDVAQKWNKKPFDVEALRREVDATFAYVKSIRKQRNSVYVFVPWGWREELKQYRTPIVKIIRELALKSGLAYVPASTILSSAARSNDGVHPNLAGSKALALKVWTGSDMNRRFN